MRIARILGLLFISLGLLAIPVPSRAQVAVGISVRIGPPVLPVYVQPICPGPNYIWIPGYWAYSDDGYFWVPGTWVIAPEPGLLWTPGYWAWDDGFYFWHAGYWGPVVGFYGGINYGFGYSGIGFYGGYWRGGNYYYNRSVTNVNVTVVHNTYNTTVVNNNTTVNRVSFNGGRGGINARPTRAEQAAEHDRHIPMTAEQTRHFEAARSDRSFLASVNHGRPDVAASSHAGEFRGRGAVENGRAGNSNRPFENRNESNHPDRSRENNDRNFPERPGRSQGSNGRYADRPPSARPSNGGSSNPGLEQKHQREFDRVRQQQDAERQKMQRQHDQERQKLDRQRPDQQRQDQLQRRQQQQMEQLNRRHDQQTQRVQEHQQRENQKQERKQSQDRKPSGLR